MSLGNLAEELTEDSYSAACAQRMGDVLNDHIKELRDVGSVEEYRNMLFGERLRIDNRMRVLADFVDLEIVANGALDRRVVFNVASASVLDRLQEICAGRRLEMVPIEGEDLNFQAAIPAPDDNELQDMTDQIDRLEKSCLGKVARVKADTLQRITAAIKREYLDAMGVQQARRSLDEIYRIYGRASIIITLKKRRAILGDRLRLKKDQEIELFARIDDEEFQSVEF